jgi:hypothetical protein
MEEMMKWKWKGLLTLAIGFLIVSAMALAAPANVAATSAAENNLTAALMNPADVQNLALTAATKPNAQMASRSGLPLMKTALMAYPFTLTANANGVQRLLWRNDVVAANDFLA